MTLSLLTCNIWFDPYQAHTRHEALLDRALATDPDVLFFQEVTEDFVAQWTARADGWTWTQARGPGETYGLLSATTHPDAAFHTLDLPSYQGRLGLTLALPDLRLTNLHLESRRPSTDTRLEQLEALLSSGEHDVLAGDFNFGQGWEEDGLCQAPWRDAWATLRPWDPGLTVDDEDNPMRAWMRPGQGRRERYDRVWYRDDRVDVVGIERCLTDVIAGHDPPITPSDHYGLRAILRAH